MDYNDPAYDEYLSTGIDPTGGQIAPDGDFEEAGEESRPYTDVDGNVYEFRDAFYNSPDLDSYRVMLYLHSGARTPQNDYERSLLREMQEIEATGKLIDFSENIW